MHIAGRSMFGLLKEKNVTYTGLLHNTLGRKCDSDQLFKKYTQ